MINLSLSYPVYFLMSFEKFDTPIPLHPSLTHKHTHTNTHTHISLCYVIVCIQICDQTSVFNV